MRIGYFLSSEEYTPQQLVEQAVLAEQAGFEALWISDHFPPGTTSSPFRLGRDRRDLPGLPAARDDRRDSAHEDMTRESSVCGRDVDRHVEAFSPYADAGFDDVYLAHPPDRQQTCRGLSAETGQGA
jgi:hypothetical protein